MDDTGREMMSSQQWLSEQLDSVVDGTPGVLLLDCRAPNDYNASHVVGAIHVAIPPLLLRRLKKGNLAVSAVISGNEGRDQFARRCREETLIVYDDCSCDANINPTGIAWLLLKKLRGDGYRARMLNGKSPSCPLGRANRHSKCGVPGSQKLTRVFTFPTRFRFGTNSLTQIYNRHAQTIFRVYSVTLVEAEEFKKCTLNN